jgi:hypothetical protein
MADTFQTGPENDESREEDKQEDGQDSRIDQNVGDEPEPKRSWDFIWKSLIIIALVILLLVGVLLPIKIVPTAVSDITGRIRNALSPNRGVTLSENEIETGDPFTLDLNTKTTDSQGTFTLFFPCREGVFLEYSKTSTSTDRETVSCETPFTFTSPNKKITFTAVSRNATSTMQPISIDYTPSPESGTSTEKVHLGDVTLTIKNPAPIGDSFAIGTTTAPVQPVATTTAATSTPVATTTPTTPRPVTQPVQNSGPTDLIVQLTRLSPGNTVQSNGTITIQFSIYNSGARLPAGWTFDVYLPAMDPAKRVYHSPAQASLGYQSGINNTLTVTNLMPGPQTITIVLKANDNNQTNNKIAVPITVY